MSEFGQGETQFVLVGVAESLTNTWLMRTLLGLMP